MPACLLDVVGQSPVQPVARSHSAALEVGDVPAARLYVQEQVRGQGESAIDDRIDERVVGGREEVVPARVEDIPAETPIWVGEVHALSKRLMSRPP